jgi:hypothetical protein
MASPEFSEEVAQRISTTIDSVAATQLVLREGQSCDRDWYEQMMDCIQLKAIVDMSRFTGTGIEFVEATIAMAGSGDHAVHRLSPPSVQLNGDRALAELPLFIDCRIDVGGVDADLAFSCRSQYRAECGADDASYGSPQSTIKTPLPRCCPAHSWKSTHGNLTSTGAHTGAWPLG